ncbi:MAG: NAD(P)-dependent glycerol-3-phosphate dehydrogenase [Myxococcales bacterium]|nr:NAD(P)-dependent glycerol-3-phosphate dehydrogenase [Myxococcales bacterium]
MEFGVLGAGAFGLSLASLLEGRGHRVTLWTRSVEAARALEECRESPRLDTVKLGAGITVTADLAHAVARRPVVLVATPSHVIREVATKMASALDPGVVVVNAAKGIEEGTLQTIDQIYGETLAPSIAARAAYLSGPTFARELARGLPAAIVVASHDPASTSLVQEQFATDRLRVYTTDDVIGVEIGGALKNVCAIGAGIADGLGYGSNTRAALITRGLSEIVRVGVRLGANPLTFMGLAGMGDLILTCTGDLSRNRRVGLELAAGRSLAEILAGMSEVAEGVRTTRAAHALGARLGVDLPITAAIHAVLYEGVRPKDAVAALMRRDPRAERG